MGLSQALSAASAGVTATQQALSVISGNVANANTPGYVEESVGQVALSTVGQSGVSVDTTGINRNLNTLLQSQLWTETSGGSYADTTAQLYQQLQQIYGTPGSSSSSAGFTATSPPRCRRSRAARVHIRRKPRWSARRSRSRKISTR